MNYINRDDEKTYIDSATTTQVFTGAGYLARIIVGTTTATALQIIDGTSGTTTNVGELAASAAVGSYEFDCKITNGLRIVSGAGKYTIIWGKT